MGAAQDTSGSPTLSSPTTSSGPMGMQPGSSESPAFFTPITSRRSTPNASLVDVDPNYYLESLKPKWSWRTFAKFIGPGYMVAVGYLDPGNWATDLEAGSKFAYRLLFVILLSNLMAVLLQSLCIKLGVVTGRDLAQSCRQYLHPKLNIIFYIFCELAIIATDLAEVIGTAIALNLLFKIPLPIGVVITGLDVLIILAGWNAKHLKYFEWFIMLLMLICGICFATLIGKSNVDWAGVGLGFIPSRALFTESGALYIALGIIGATVMPHNLYLHSSIVKYRGAPASITELGAIRDIDISDGEAERQPLQPLHRKRSLPMTLLMTHVDSIVALTFALTINAAILIVSAANFNNSDDPDQSPAELADAYRLLNKHLGPAAGTLFALALLLAGQSSTITGTMAGQIVMEGFFGSNFGIKPWMRRLVTRSVAIIPAIVVALVKGESGVNQLLVWSQVVLSLQLPFAVWPLVYFTSRKDIMTIRYQVSAHPPSYDHITDAGRRSSSSDSTVVSQSGESDGAESLSDKEEGDQSEEDQGVQVGYGNGRIIMFLAVSVALLITGFNVVLLIQIARGVD